MREEGGSGDGPRTVIERMARGKRKRMTGQTVRGEEKEIKIGAH